MARPRIGIVIPALNEEGSIAEVVRRAREFGAVIVVDDGSSDKTSERALGVGAEVVRHHRNQGYDAALNSGFARAADIGCTAVITLDADGQHDPLLVQKFIDALDGDAAVVFGVRDRFQRIGERVFSWVSRWRWNIKDPLCGMKAYKMEIYLELGHFDSYKSIGTELGIFAVIRGCPIVEVPVRTRDRVGVTRFGSSLVGNWRILRSLILSQIRVVAAVAR